MRNQRKSSDNFSQGCRACQDGTWLCIFLTYLCSAHCTFCPAPSKNEDKIVSSFGDDPEQILENIQGKSIDAISFSGGDCFLVFDRLLDWLRYFKRNRPDIYYWAYTSGLEADIEKLIRLAEGGLNETRFNIAATGYKESSVLEKIAASTKIFEKVAVEIPSIPEDFPKVIEILPHLEDIGVDYLNLHEYILVPEDPRIHTAVSETFVLNKETPLRYDVHSQKNTEKIIGFCHQKGLKIQVNNCSNEKKEIQMTLRRLFMGGLWKKEHENLTEDGLLETYLAYPSQLSPAEIKKLTTTEEDLLWLEKYFVNPHFYERQDIGSNAGTRARLLFLPPMGIDEKRILYSVDLLK